MKRKMDDEFAFSLIMGNMPAYELLATTEADVLEQAAIMVEEGENISDEDIEAAIRGLRTLQNKHG
jgi:hypothetical protein